MRQKVARKGNKIDDKHKRQAFDITNSEDILIVNEIVAEDVMAEHAKVINIDTEEIKDNV